MQARNMLIAAAVALALAQPAFAKKDRDDDESRHPGKGWAKGWDKKGGRESGPHAQFENSAEKYKYEFRDASCRYKYEYNYRNGKSKVEQRGDCSGFAFPQRVAMQGREPLPRAIPPEPQARTIECNREVIGAVLGGAAGAGAPPTPCGHPEAGPLRHPFQPDLPPVGSDAPPGCRICWPTGTR